MTKRKPGNKMKFNNHNNPFNLKWETVKSRIKSGKTFEEAINYPLVYNNKSESRKCDDRKKFDKHHNPHNLKWTVVAKRLERGWSFEKAISEPVNSKLSHAATNRVKSSKTKMQLFLELENPFNLEFKQVVKRTEHLKISVEEAMSFPIGRYPITNFKNGWVMFYGKWTSTKDLEMIFDLETTENMIKTKVPAERLFRKINH